MDCAYGLDCWDAGTNASILLFGSAPYGLGGGCIPPYGAPYGLGGSIEVGGGAAAYGLGGGAP